MNFFSSIKILIITFTLIFSVNTIAIAYKPSKIVIEKVDIQINNLPPEFENYTIAQISDLHLSDAVDKSIIEKVIEKTNSLNADCIIITGDVANSPEYLKECIELLNNLSANDGVYIVPGNREKAIGMKYFIDLIAKTKIIPLIDTSKFIERNNSKILLIGLSENAGKAPELNAILENIESSLVKIVCVHNPYIVFNLENIKSSLDLILAGHTHGGQVVYPVIGAFKAPKQDGHKLVSGLYKFDQTQLYINRGIGVSQFYYRINCPPEITLITLTKQQ